jgi:integrase/recombinase XerC
MRHEVEVTRSTATDPRTMQNWRADTKASLRLTRKQRATKGAFSVDAKRYLAAVVALPTYRQRAHHIAFWVREFGDRHRADIESADIRAVRDRLLTQPRSATDSRPLAPGSVNKLLRALSNVWAVLDGKRSQNPVREVPEATEPDPHPRALDYGTITRILAALPPSRAKARLSVLAYCPLTPQQLEALIPNDLEIGANGETSCAIAGRLRLPARLKGKGAAALWTPVSADGLAALREFDRLNCYGRFARGPLRRAFSRAARRAGVTQHVHPYMLRHSFATLVYRATGSLETVGDLLQHSHRSTTARYALSATEGVLGAAMQQVSDLLDRGSTYWHDIPAGHGKSRPKTAGKKRVASRRRRAGDREKSKKTA